MVLLRTFWISTTIFLFQVNKLQARVSRKYKQLPSFANDYSELFMAAVLERSFNSYDIYLVMFLMGHAALFNRPQQPFLMINNVSSTVVHWQNAARKWDANRIVDTTYSGLVCKTKLASNNTPSVSEAMWVPSRTTTDSGFNKHLEILRCKLTNGEEIYSRIPEAFAKNGRIEKLSVEVLRIASKNSVESDSMSLVRFQVPLLSRRTGYSMASALGSSRPRKNSQWDPWMNNHPNIYSQPNPVHICMSFVRPLEPYRMDTGIVMLLENIEHHINLGFDHIFVALNLDESSIHMQRYRLALDSYVVGGKVSIASMALAGYDDVAGIIGTNFIDDYARWIHQQQCLYVSKGVASHVALLHAGEFLVLKPPIASIHQLLAAPSVINMLTASKRKPCYYVVETLGVPDPDGPKSSFGPGDNYWTADFFAGSLPLGPLPSWITLILPTTEVWIVGWHVCGACSQVSPTSKDVAEGISPWSSEPVSMESHAAVLAITQAVTYFYRGKFEPWQLAKPRHPGNEHLELFGVNTQARLEAKGFHLSSGGKLTYEVAADTVLKFYPQFYGGNRKERKGRKERKESYIAVELSSVRSKPWEATLAFSELLSARQLTPVGKKALLAEGTWMECNTNGKCEHPVDLLRVK